MLGGRHHRRRRRCLEHLASHPPCLQTLVPLNDTECAGKAAGKWPPWNLPLPPHPPLCQGAYVECDGASPSGELVEDGLGSLPAPGGSSVPAVFSWLTRGGVLPGAIGTRGCDCEAAYGRDAEGAVACRVCEALQDAALCDARRAANDSTYACLAPFPDQEQRHIECTVQGARSWLAGSAGVLQRATRLHAHLRASPPLPLPPQAPLSCKAPCPAQWIQPCRMLWTSPWACEPPVSVPPAAAGRSRALLAWGPGEQRLAPHRLHPKAVLPPPAPPFRSKEPTKRFAVFVQQDLADPMLDTLAT